MYGLKLLLACVLVVLLGYSFVWAEAKAPEGATSPKPTPKAEPTPAGKSPVAEGSSSDKTDASSELCQCINRDNAASTKKIEQALAGPLHSNGLDYADVPLQDVLTQISDDYGIPIQLDKTALEEAGIGTDSQVTVTLHNISFRSALRLMLRTVQLTWIIRDEVLMVTTKESAEKQIDTCVYNVQGLVDDSDPKSVKALIDVIYGCVQSDTWATNGGGQAEVRPLPSGLFVVSQTPAVQEEVSALLNKIRKMREKAPLTKVGPRGYEPPPANPSPRPTRETKKGGGGGGGFDSDTNESIKGTTGLSPSRQVRQLT
jgi:hypothetical protein